MPALFISPPRLVTGAIDVSQASLGTPPDYTEFSIDGTMTAYGNATTWRDELGILIGSRLESPSSDIVENVAEGTMTFKDSARYPTDYIMKTYQINHDWNKLAVRYHVHWFQTSAANVNWLAGYRWQINGQEKEDAFTLIPLKTSVFTYSYLSHRLVQINDIIGSITPPAMANVSDFFQVRFYRDYTNTSGLFDGAETSGLDVDALASDIHRQSNQMGSPVEYSK